MITEYDFLKSWILKFLSTPQKMLNGFPPCPYAKKVLIDNKIKFFKSENYLQDISSLFDAWDDSYEVAICIVPDDENCEEFVKNTDQLNKIYLPNGFACLEDHKDIPENFFDISFNNGRYNIILCQRIEKINDASKTLLNKGYFDNWTKEMYDQVVSWRFETTS